MEFFHSEPWKGVKKLKVWRQPITSWKHAIPNDWNWHSALWCHCCLERCCNSGWVCHSWGRFLELNTNLMTGLNKCFLISIWNAGIIKYMWKLKLELASKYIKQWEVAQLYTLYWDKKKVSIIMESWHITDSNKVTIRWSSTVQLL